MSTGEKCSWDLYHLVAVSTVFDKEPSFWAASKKLTPSFDFAQDRSNSLPSEREDYNDFNSYL